MFLKHVSILRLNWFWSPNVMTDFFVVVVNYGFIEVQ